MCSADSQVVPVNLPPLPDIAENSVDYRRSSDPRRATFVEAGSLAGNYNLQKVIKKIKNT